MLLKGNKALIIARAAILFLSYHPVNDYFCFFLKFRETNQGEDLIGVDGNDSNLIGESQLLSARSHCEAPPQEQSDFVDILLLKARTDVRVAFTDRHLETMTR